MTTNLRLLLSLAALVAGWAALAVVFLLARSVLA
jgi:hypothetical protein